MDNGIAKTKERLRVRTQRARFEKKICIQGSNPEVVLHRVRVLYFILFWIFPYYEYMFCGVIVGQ